MLFVLGGAHAVEEKSVAAIKIGWKSECAIFSLEGAEIFKRDEIQNSHF